ncbi:MAG TPA: tetratricopeptide repeat protein, partial [Nitrososphaerales archaeon]|nr:tetratricopeptide repeat protein [Nitrososphaerales archaeon]
PNSAEAHYRYALLLNDMLRNSEALAEVAAAEELDPLSVAVNQIAGSILYFAGRNDEAIERLERAIEMDSRAAFAHNNLGLALCKRGDLEAGLEQIRAAMELDPKNAMFRADLCYAYSMAGRQEEAKGVLLMTEEESRSTRVPPMAIAGMHASLGDSDKALQWLERAYEEHSPYFASLKVEKWFDGLRSDERFQGLMRRARLV